MGLALSRPNLLRYKNISLPPSLPWLTQFPFSNCEGTMRALMIGVTYQPTSLMLPPLVPDPGGEEGVTIAALAKNVA